MLKPSFDFNQVEITEIEKTLSANFSSKQILGFTEWYNNRYFKPLDPSIQTGLPMSFFMPQIISFIIFKSIENEIIIWMTCTSSNSGERKDYSVVLIFDLNDSISALKLNDYENDSTVERVSKRERINNIIENSTQLLILKN